MSKHLTEQIAYHIFASLGILSSNFVDKKSMRSILDKSFLLSEKISFEDEGKVIRNNVYGCQVTVSDNKELRMLVADCTQDKKYPEFALLVQLKDSPSFGVYSIVNNKVDSETLIAVSADHQNWMPCSVYLQATFLAGMEQTRDVGFGWAKASDYSDQYQQLLSFIKFHHSYYQEADEGQEE